MIINIDGKELIRYSDSEQWKEEASKFFDLSQKQARIFDEIEGIDKLSWKLLKANSRLMPSSFSDFISLLKPANLILNLQGLFLVPGLFISFEKFLRRYKLQNNNRFRRFIDEQLIITTQSYTNKAPYLSAALGLAYPSEVYYPLGSIVSLAQLIEKNFIENGGEILYRQKVENIESNTKRYVVSTEEERAKRSLNTETRFCAKNIISNTPIWNLEKISPKKISKKIEPYTKRSPETWGAFMIYLTLKGKLDLKAHYYQIHTNTEIPHCKSKSFFMTVSLEDPIKTEPGFQSITISTHTECETWLNQDTEEYEKKKKEVEEFILEELYRKYPVFLETETIHLSTGSPKSFEHYTQRKNGYVGGIPHSIDNPIINMCPNQLSDSFYLVGDTCFPGQGIAAVVYSAISVSNKIS